MRDLNQKKVLQNQERVVYSKKASKNQDRVIFPHSFRMTGKKKRDPISAKEEAEWRALFAMIVLLLFGGSILLISLVGDYGLLSTSTLQQKEKHLETEILKLRDKEQIVLKEIKALQSNSDYIELLARKDLGLVYPQEKIYYFSNQASPPKKSSVVTSSPYSDD